MKYKILESLIAAGIILIVGMISVAMTVPVITKAKNLIEDINMQQQDRVNQYKEILDSIN